MKPSSLIVLILALGLALLSAESKASGPVAESGKIALEAEAEFVNPFAGLVFNDFDSPSVPHLQLTLKPVDFRKIVAKRNYAITQNILESSSDDYVRGVIRNGKDKAKVKLRLKGDYTEHLKEDKWSFRVKVKGNKTVLGMKVFSLQHPKMRLFLHEWVILKALASEGLISLRYSFVKLSVNGIYLGLFNLEEHFEKRLVENNSRREGPIFKFDEAELFRLINNNTYDGGRDDDRLFLNASVLPFQKKKTSENGAQKQLFEKAASLLDAFRKGQARVDEVFNVDQFAKLYAISDVFMGKHGVRWHNQRFYFNPIDSRIEPVGFDFNDDKSGLDPLARMNRNHGLFYGTNWAFDVFSRMMFSDPKFFVAYKKHAERISSRAYLDQFFNSIEVEAKKEEAILVNEFDKTKYDKYIHFDDKFKKAYYENQDYVRKSIKSKQPLRVHLKKITADSMTVVYNNRSEHLLEVIEYRVGDKIYPIDNPDYLHTYRFYNPYIGSTQNLANMTIATDQDLRGKELVFRYRSLGGGEVWEAALEKNGAPTAPPPRKPRLGLESGHPMRTLPTDLSAYPFFKVQGEKIVGLPGSWVLDKTLIFPKNKKIELSAGMKIDFRDGASLIASSTFDSLGTPENPVLLFSSDKTGGGVFVANAKTASNWQYTYVSDLSAPAYEEWKPTGAVTFFKSPLTVRYSRFENNRSEDGLNTVNTNVNIRNSYFSNTFSDAFDADFCTGYLGANTFENTGNDAVDVSGSVIHISDLTINNAGDKAVSVGERSKISINQLVVNRAAIGLASKDSSELRVNGAILNGVKIGVCGYQKKPEYGPPTIHLQNIKIHRADLPMLFEPKSIVTIDNVRVEKPLGKKQKLIFDSLRDGKQLN